MGTRPGIQKKGAMMVSLEEKILQFERLQLPGQLPAMHMGTYYLVRDLWEEVKRLRKENEKLSERPPGSRKEE